jgi:hypothetical protein
VTDCAEGKEGRIEAKGREEGAIKYGGERVHYSLTGGDTVGRD